MHQKSLAAFAARHAIARRSLLSLALASAFPMASSFAQEVAPEAKADQSQLQEVIVTAQRRAENLREVPVSISVLKGDTLDTYNSGGQDIRFLAARVPSLNIESSYGRAFPRFYIRGLGNTDFDLNASQPVSLVYDDVVQENPILKGFPVFDLERVEVLRGPQGTLFGRNSPAGVVKFDSVKPGRTLEGYANVSYGTYSTVNVEGAVNAPINEDWAMRVSMQSQHRDDWVHNTFNGPTKNFEGYRDTAARVQFLYKPSADFSALINLHGRDMDGSARLFRANIIQKGTNDLVPNFHNDQIATDGANGQNLKNSGGSLRLRWELEDFTLHSITGYETVKTYSRGDVDGGYGASFAQPSGPGFIPFTAESADGLPDHKQFTQEFRVESKYKGPLNWIGGLYYFDEDISIDSFDYNTLAGGAQDGYAWQKQKNKAWAAFATVNYSVTDALKLRGGVRYTDDKKDFSAQRTQSPVGAGASAVLYANPRATNTSWDFSADYALNKDTNVYTRVATGFRAPSVQGRLLFGDSISVANSEKVTSYEAGIKSDLFAKRARVSFSVFNYTVKDQQLTAVGGQANFNRLVNADKTEGRGAELEFEARVTPNLMFTVGGSYNKTEIKDKNLAIAACGSGCTVLDPKTAAGTYLIDGNSLPQSPKWVGNFTARYSIPTAQGEYFIFTDWAYRSKINFFLYDSVEYTGKPLTEGGVRAGYKWNNDKYEIAAYGRNITNQVRVVGGIDFNNLTGFVNEPRIWGVQFKAAF
ncbi:TonB-dependent receptor [Undibacterium terreum]|uniref:TonB-dependent receptor n=1 Tax=Undibacterium terreum TaxID=1224302 RepID=A0A916USD4_9BURK|nr:TonB-dependent receptor [Undibacterium terreum]GGC84593.1 TonB-dependent receptor [Undibacterium terreum]